MVALSDVQTPTFSGPIFSRPLLSSFHSGGLKAAGSWENAPNTVAGGGGGFKSGVSHSSFPNQRTTEEEKRGGQTSG